MKIRSLLFSLLLAALPHFALSADVTGVWKAEFDTQIGLQKYTYTFKQDGTKVLGKANADIGGEKHDAELKEVKLEGDALTFVELMNFQGNEVRISYRGKVTDKEIKFTRDVGEFAKEEFTAKREAATAASAPAPHDHGK